MERQGKNFRINAYLTLVSGKLFLDEKMGETKEDILEESMNIISYMTEDIDPVRFQDKNINSICIGKLQCMVDPLYIEIAKETTKNNYTKNKLILHKLMGNEIEINKINNSLLDTIDNYKQKKKI